MMKTMIIAFAIFFILLSGCAQPQENVNTKSGDDDLSGNLEGLQPPALPADEESEEIAPPPELPNQEADGSTGNPPLPE